MYPAEFCKGLVDEDEGDKDGEDLLGEACHKSHQKAPFKGHRENYNDDQPNSNPCTSCQKLDFIGPAELKNTWIHGHIQIFLLYHSSETFYS